ncbi:MAG: hypothetical protein ABJB01_07685 [Rudaea sp.]
MTFANDTQESRAIEHQREHTSAASNTYHIEETPCRVISPVVVPPAASVRLWQARSARTWMT